MRILIIHNNYRTIGGEETVVQSETELLRGNGHTVEHAFQNSSSIDGYGPLQKLSLLGEMAWSQQSFAKIRDLTREFRADIVHVHNTHPLWSPAVFAAAHSADAATVMTLHNFRLVCMNTWLARDGQGCTECLGRKPWPGVLHRCGQGSLVGSLAMARMMLVNQQRGTWTHDVDAFIALTDQNSKQTFVRAGIPKERIHVKPNFIRDPLLDRGKNTLRHGAVFIGQLTKIKAAATLIEAWRGIDYPLYIVGKGPLSDGLRAAAPDNVEFTGELPLSAILDLLSKTSFVVFPSVAREGLPRVIIEAFAMGRAVVASRHGAMAEIVRHNETGLLYEPGDVADLRRQLERLIRDPKCAEALGNAARREYIEKYTTEINYCQLIRIYEHALARHKSLRLLNTKS